MRSLVWTLLLALAALALWACTGGDSDTDVPVGDNTATPNLARVNPSCDAVQDVESYRFVFEIRRDLPITEETDEATPDPLSQFADALAALLGDMTVEGAFVVPDRSEISVRSGGEELEVRTIGNKSWIRLGATWQEQEPPDEESLFTLASICEDLLDDLADSLAAVSGEEKLVNGIETIHYRLNETDLKRLPKLLGRSGEEGLPDKFFVGAWLDRDDGWPVRLEVAASDVDEEGESISEEWFIEFSDIDDPNIEIQPPPVSPAQT